MKVAIPTESGKIYPYFGDSKEFTVYDVEHELVQSIETVSAKECGGRMIDFLIAHSINVVVCGNIESNVKSALRERRIELVRGVCGDANNVLVRYLSGEALGSLEADWAYDNYNN